MKSPLGIHAKERIEGVIHSLKTLEDFLEEDNQPSWIVTEVMRARTELRSIMESE